VRKRRAHERRVQHAGQAEVVHVGAASADQVRVLDPRHCISEYRTGHAVTLTLVRGFPPARTRIRPPVEPNPIVLRLISTPKGGTMRTRWTALIGLCCLG